MKKKIIPAEVLLDDVRRRFKEISGVEEETDAWAAIEDTEEKLLNHIFRSAVIKYNLELYPFVRESECCSFAGLSFSLPVSGEKEWNKIRKAAPYIVTLAGVNGGENLTAFEQVCVDILGTSFIDVSMDRIKEDIHGTGIKYISPSLGPGYYGLSLNDVYGLYRIMDGSGLGIQVSQNGILTPEKSGTGFFLLSNEKIDFPACCRNCSGMKQSCRLCRIRMDRGEGR